MMLEVKNIKKNFKPGEWGKFKVFYMQGGLDYDHMEEMDRMLLTAYRYILKLSKRIDFIVYSHHKMQ